MDKESLINKIANSIDINDIEKTAAPKKEMIKLASTMLKVAAEDIRSLKQQVNDLTSKISSYEKDKEFMEKKSEVDSIVDSMFNKGLIKKADIESKKYELLKIGGDALTVMKDTINSIPEKVAEDSVSNLTFLYQGNNIKEKESLSESINEYIK